MGMTFFAVCSLGYSFGKLETTLRFQQKSLDQQQKTLDEIEHELAAIRKSK